MKKTFDCVDMKNECAKKVRRLIGSVSIKQELAFWKKRAESLRARAALGRTRTVAS